MTQQPNRNTLPDDNNNPFTTFVNRLSPAAMAFVVLVLVMGVLLLLSNDIGSTSTTRGKFIDTSVTAAATAAQPAQTTAAIAVATAAATAAAAK
jgi:hypothetical protein